MSQVKFKTRFLSTRPPRDKVVTVLLDTCHAIAARGLTHGTSGNASVRTKGGFIISGAGTSLAHITSSEFVKVVGLSIDDDLFFAKGKREPSSESKLHWVIYEARPEISAILHLHDDIILHTPAYELGIPHTFTHQRSGSIGLTREVLLLFRRHPDARYFILSGHGTITLGKDLKEAFELACDVHDRAVEIKKEEEQIRTRRANEEKVKKIVAWQCNPRVAPLTCGNNPGHNFLHPRMAGEDVELFCPDCDYVQHHVPDDVFQ